MLLGHYGYVFGSLWHFCTSYWVDISFQFPWVVLRSGMAGSKLTLVERNLVLFTGWGWRRGSGDRYREGLGRRKLALEKGYFLQHPSLSLLAQPYCPNLASQLLDPPHTHHTCWPGIESSAWIKHPWTWRRCIRASGTFFLQQFLVWGSPLVRAWPLLFYFP